jgi:peptidoglycan hydrolase CwlO-like protein
MKKLNKINELEQKANREMKVCVSRVDDLVRGIKGVKKEVGEVKEEMGRVRQRVDAQVNDG